MNDNLAAGPETLSGKEFALLAELDNGDNSQRQLAARLDISLGMVNLFLRKLSTKGLIKIKKLGNARTLQYILTPAGFRERANYNLHFIKQNAHFFASAQQSLTEKLTALSAGTSAPVYIYGTGDFSKLVYLGVLDLNLDFQGFVDYPLTTRLKFNHPVRLPEELTAPAVVIISREERARLANLPAGVTLLEV